MVSFLFGSIDEAAPTAAAAKTVETAGGGIA